MLKENRAKTKKKGSIKTTIILGFGGLLVFYAVASTIVTDIFLERVFRNVVQENMVALTRQVGHTIEYKLQREETLVYELANNAIMTDKEFTEEDRINFYTKRLSNMVMKCSFTAIQPGLARI